MYAPDDEINNVVFSRIAVKHQFVCAGKCFRNQGISGRIAENMDRMPSHAGSFIVYCVPDETFREALINCLCGMKCKAHGAQEPRHIQKYVEVAGTANAAIRPHRQLISASLAQY